MAVQATPKRGRPRGHLALVEESRIDLYVSEELVRDRFREALLAVNEALTTLRRIRVEFDDRTAA